MIMIINIVKSIDGGKELCPQERRYQGLGLVNVNWVRVLGFGLRA